MRHSLLAILLSLASCNEARQPAKPARSAEPAATGATAEGRCDRFLRHVGSLTGFDDHGAGDRAYCEALTTEQQECGLAADTGDALALCLQFDEPGRRATARSLTPSVRASWPGTHPLLDVVNGQAGCAFGGLVGTAGVPLGEDRVVASFGVREANRTGDPEIILAWLTRAAPADEWTCATTDPPERCIALRTACRR